MNTMKIVSRRSLLSLIGLGATASVVNAAGISSSDIVDYNDNLTGKLDKLYLQVSKELTPILPGRPVLPEDRKSLGWAPWRISHGAVDYPYHNLSAFLPFAKGRSATAQLDISIDLKDRTVTAFGHELIGRRDLALPAGWKWKGGTDIGTLICNF